MFLGKQRPTAQEDLDFNYQDVAIMNSVAKVGAGCWSERNTVWFWGAAAAVAAAGQRHVHHTASATAGQLAGWLEVAVLLRCCGGRMQLARARLPA